MSRKPFLETIGMYYCLMGYLGHVFGSIFDATVHLGPVNYIVSTVWIIVYAWIFGVFIRHYDVTYGVKLKHHWDGGPWTMPMGEFAVMAALADFIITGGISTSTTISTENANLLALAAIMIYMIASLKGYCTRIFGQD